MRVLGDFDAAEEVVQDALLAAWEQWPVDGIPRRPAAWLWTVARRRAVDVLRRDVRYRRSWPRCRGRADRTTMTGCGCIALGQVVGADAALAEVDALAGEPHRYHLYHATRDELLRELGHPAEARRTDEQALGLTGNPAERALLEQRLA